MSSEHGRSVVFTLDESRTRIQTVAELLLLSCTPKPVYTGGQDASPTTEAFVKFRDKVMAQLNKVLLLTRDIATQVHSSQIQMRQLCHRVKEMGQSVISLSELSSHIAYLMALHFEGAEPALSGPVSAVHQLSTADLDLQFCCNRLKRSRMNDLQPNLLVDMCSSITKSITAMSDICRQAAEKALDSNDQEQFKLCVRTITSTTGLLVSSIKSFKHQPSEVHLRRVMTFCDPVTSSSAALLAFASEENFTGMPAALPKDAMELYKSIMGLSMSIASASVQICKAVRDLVYSSSTKRHRDRISLCVESITRSSGQLRDFLLNYQPHCAGKAQIPYMRHVTDVPSSHKSPKNREKRSHRHSHPSSSTPTKENSSNNISLSPTMNNFHKDKNKSAGPVQSFNNCDNNADDSGICDEKGNSSPSSSQDLSPMEIVQTSTSFGAGDSLSTPSPTLSTPFPSRPTSAVIDNMFACEDKLGLNDSKSSLDLSPSTSLTCVADNDSGVLVTRVANKDSDGDVSVHSLNDLPLTTESTLPEEHLSEGQEFFLKPHHV